MGSRPNLCAHDNGGIDPGCGGEDHDSQEPDGDADDLHCEKQDKTVPNGDYPVVVDVLCGVPPPNVKCGNVPGRAVEHTP